MEKPFIAALVEAFDVPVSRHFTSDIEAPLTQVVCALPVSGCGSKRKTVRDSDRGMWLQHPMGRDQLQAY